MYDMRLKKESEARANARNSMDDSFKHTLLDKDSERNWNERQTMADCSRQNYLLNDVNRKKFERSRNQGRTKFTSVG